MSLLLLLTPGQVTPTLIPVPRCVFEAGLKDETSTGSKKTREYDSLNKNESAKYSGSSLIFNSGDKDEVF